LLISDEFFSARTADPLVFGGVGNRKTVWAIAQDDRYFIQTLATFPPMGKTAVAVIESVAMRNCGKLSTFRASLFLWIPIWHVSPSFSDAAERPA
jgi:hypothetical protein